MTEYALLTTERAAAWAGARAAAPRRSSTCRPGASTRSRPSCSGETWRAVLVALGGGRVVDTAKAIAGVPTARCAAMPTTLSGAEMTPFHRTPGRGRGRAAGAPALVVADPGLMAAQPSPSLAATRDERAGARAGGALHAAREPGGELAALRAAALLAAGW